MRLWISQMRSKFATKWGVMRIVEEIESEFQTSRAAKPESSAEVYHCTGSTTLRGPVFGEDFISGLGPAGLVAFPNSKLRRVVTMAIPDQSQITLRAFLAGQRLPVRIEVLSGDRLIAGWLLTIQGSWLRLATQLQVIWCPLEAVTKVEVQAVENLQQ